jgi:NADPH-dependent 2,4-dienoyl-CoA reductase/sulfur reductase-like enzyme
MKEKVVIIGGVGGGATTASQIRKLNDKMEIVIFEKTEYVSFGACGMPYYIGDIIEERDHLFAATPETLTKKVKANVKVRHEVLSIDRKNKIVKVKDLKNDRSFEERYDYLVLAPGASAIIPPINGLQSIPHFTLRHIENMDKIKEFINDQQPKKCSIIGAGFIGLEVAENLKHLGIEVTVVERSDHVLSIIDKDISEHILKELEEQGISVHMGNALEKVLPNRTLLLSSGKELEADFIIMAAGIEPNNSLAKDAGLSIGESGGIQTNAYMQTEDPSIYAVGDAVESIDFIDKSKKQVPLAWPAHRQSFIAAKNITGTKQSFEGMLGTAITKVFDLAVASTGFNEKTLKQKNFPFATVQHEGKSHAGYYPGAKSVLIKVHFCTETGKIYGANIVGGEGVDKRIDVLATAILGGLTITDLQAIETSYSPPYSSPKDLLNIIGYKGEQMLLDHK